MARAGAESTWTLSLPATLRAFDYLTISDVILHVRYTARQAGDPLGSQAIKELQGMLAKAGESAQTLSFCLRYDFPTEWAAFVNDPNGTASFRVTLTPDHFPYMARAAKTLIIDSFSLSESASLRTSNTADKDIFRHGNSVTAGLPLSDDPLERIVR